MLSALPNRMGERQRLCYWYLVFVILVISMAGRCPCHAQRNAFRCGDDLAVFKEENPGFVEAESVLFRTYNDTCAEKGLCQVSVVPGTSTQIRDFSELDGTVMGRFERACRRMRGHRSCRLSTDVIRETDSEFGEIGVDSLSFRRIELDRPVCLPSACAIDRKEDVILLHFDTQTDGCVLVDGDDTTTTTMEDDDDVFGDVDPTTEEMGSEARFCSILNVTAECPPDDVDEVDDDQGGFGWLRGTDDGDATCSEQAAIVREGLVFRSIDFSMVQNVLRSCLNSMVGGGGAAATELCDVTASLRTTGAKDFSVLSAAAASSSYEPALAKAYEEFRTQCFGGGGRVCTVSATLDSVDSAGTFLNMDTHLEYDSYPVCLPLSCSEDSPAAFAENLLFRDYACTDTSLVCDVVVSDFTCEWPTF